MGSQLLHRAAATASTIVTIALLPAFTNAQAVVRGVLYDDATGQPVRGTVMLVDPSTDAAVFHTTTDSLGQFSIETKNGAGRFQIAAVRPGYTSVLSAPVSLQNGERITLRVPIASVGDPQHQIGVIEHIRADGSGARAADARSNLQNAYAARKARGMGLHYDRAQLAKSTLNSLGEFLQGVPGFMVLDPGSSSSMQVSRNAGAASGGLRGPMGGSCHVGWFVDGHRMDLPGRSDALTDGIGSMQLESIEAVEVFRGLSEMPPEFSEPDLRCGAISVWTRR